MRKIIYKTFWAWNFDKEEKWLNEMAAKGLVLAYVGYCKYVFDECTPGEYNVRLELLENVPRSAESQQYIKFIEETGAEYIGSVTRWVYFRRKTDGGEFNLYSDNASRVKHLGRILALLGALTVMNVCIGFANVMIHQGFGANFMLGMVNLSVAILTGCGFVSVLRKRREIKKQQNLFE